MIKLIARDANNIPIILLMISSNSLLIFERYFENNVPMKHRNNIDVDDSPIIK